MKVIVLIILFGMFIFPQRLFATKANALEKKIHFFSSVTEVDTFKLSYNSDNLQDTIVFEIISSKGNLIYQVKFPGFALFDDGKPSYMFISDKGWKPKDYYKNAKDSIVKTDSLRIEDDRYLRSRIAGFFDEKRFSRNPIPKLLKEYKDNLIVGSYETLLNDPDVIGFSYHLDAEDGRMIAFLRKKNRVINFWRCC